MSAKPVSAVGSKAYLPLLLVVPPLQISKHLIPSKSSPSIESWRARSPAFCNTGVSLNRMELHDELISHRPCDERLGLLDAFIVDNRCLEVRVDRCEE